MCLFYFSTSVIEDEGEFYLCDTYITFFFACPYLIPPRPISSVGQSSRRQSVLLTSRHKRKIKLQARDVGPTLHATRCAHKEEEEEEEEEKNKFLIIRRWCLVVVVKYFSYVFLIKLCPSDGGDFFSSSC